VVDLSASHGSPEAFVVKLGPGKEGHEALTRRAVSGLTGYSAADVRALVAGVRRVDVGKGPLDLVPALAGAFRATEQRRHALRRDLCQPLAATRREIVDLLFVLHGRALRATTRDATMGWLGEALHLIQDSYSPAHVDRERGTSGRHPIRYIRYFGPRGRPYPLEHRVFPPPDPRDVILGPSGALTPWAAEAVVASREFAIIVARHLGGGTSLASRRRDIRTFAAKHFALSPRRTDPSVYYPSCR